MLIPTPAFLLNLKLDLSAETTHWFSQVHSIPPNAGFIIVKSLLVIISLLQYQRFWKMKRKEKGKYYRVYYVLWQYYRTYFIMLGKRMWFVYTIWFFILWNSHVSHANLAITISSSQNVILWTELIYKLATFNLPPLFCSLVVEHTVQLLVQDSVLCCCHCCSALTTI